MNRSRSWIVLAALLLPAVAFASTGTTPRTTTSRRDPAPIGRLAGTTVKSSKSNSQDRMAAPDAASAASSVKGSKSNSSERMAAPPQAPAGSSGAGRPAAPPPPPGAVNLNSSKSN